MSSIRRFLILISLAVITLVNFISALQGYRTGVESTDTLLGKMLEEKAWLVAGLSELSSERDVVQFPLSELFFQIFDANAQLQTRSESAPEYLLGNLEEGFSTETFAGYRWRLFTLPMVENNRVVVVGERLDFRYFLAEETTIKTILPWLMGLPFLIVLMWFVVTQGLKPLEMLSKKVSDKRSHDLSPINQVELPSELQPLLDSMNGLLVRLSESFDREKRFSGDAAHELRTPISALKVNLYNLKSQLPSGNQDIELMEQSLSRMIHLIEQLLLLYRISPEQYQANFVTIELKKLCQEAIVEKFASIDLRSQEISLQVQDEEVCFLGDEFAMKTLIKNLIDNANKYAPDGGVIKLFIQKDNEFAELIIEDSGNGIPVDLRERVFERFYRAFGDCHDSSVEGCGLGLSIVKHIVDLHDGDISLHESESLKGLKVVIRLPLNFQKEVEVE